MFALVVPDESFPAPGYVPFSRLRAWASGDRYFMNRANPFYPLHFWPTSFHCCAATCDPIVGTPSAPRFPKCSSASSGKE